MSEIVDEKPVEKKKKEKKNSAIKKKMDIGALGIIDNLVFNKNYQWAYYKIANTPHDFLSNEGRVAVANQIINAFVNIMGDKQDPLECHLIVASTPIDIDAWEYQIYKMSDTWEKGPGFDQYMLEQARMLRQAEYLKKVTYLGINLGRRNELAVDAASFVEAGLAGAWDVTKRWLNTTLQNPTEAISASEENAARRKEAEFYRIISTGNLRGERCTAEEILLSIKRQFYPAMRVPYLDIDHENRVGPGDLELELTSAINNKLRWLEFNQMIDGEEEIGYRATMTISRLPKEIIFPYTFPFMYAMHQIGMPFTSYARFSLFPNSNMKKKLEKKEKEQKDEIENLENSALDVAPTDVVDAMHDRMQLRDLLARDKTPWVVGSYRFVIETATEEQLKEFCSTVKQRFSDIDVHIQWTVGDQAQLFLEQMPGDRERITDNKLTTNLAFLGTSGFSYSSDVGDIINEEGDY